MLHPLLETVFHAFAKEGVRWCLLRGEAELHAPTGDVDLLIARPETERVEHILETLEFVQLPAYGRGSHIFFLSYHPPTDCWIKLDIVTEISYGPYFAVRTWAEAGCLARRQRDGLVFVLDPDDAFWTLLLHCLLDKSKVAVHRGMRLKELAGAARTNGPLAQIVDGVCPAGWNSARIVEYVRRGDWTALEHFAPALMKMWIRQRPIRSVTRVLINRVLRLLEKPLPLVRRRGLGVALLGPDGAGKSTLAAEIRKSFYFPVRSVYMGMWQRPTGPRRAPQLPGFAPLSRLLKIWWRYLVAQYHQALGQLVIFDRYTYDALLPPRRRLNSVVRLYVWLLAHACPGPDLVLVLDAPGHVMYERKGENTPEALEAERQGFLGLRQQIPQLQVVDVTRPADIVRADVVGRIWGEYVTRWSKH